MTFFWLSREVYYNNNNNNNNSVALVRERKLVPTFADRGCRVVSMTDPWICSQEL
jgi:hypothetical protein